MYIVFVPGRVRKRAIRRDGKWRDLSGGVKKRGRSGLENKKTSGVWIKLFTLPFCRSSATNLPHADSSCITKQEVHTPTTTYLNPGGNTKSQTNFFPYFKFPQ